MRKKAKITVEEAAKILSILEVNTGPQQIRYGLRSGSLPIGYAIKNEEKNHWSYYIVPARFCKYMRLTKEELEEMLEQINTNMQKTILA